MRLLDLYLINFKCKILLGKHNRHIYIAKLALLCQPGEGLPEATPDDVTLVVPPILLLV